MIPGGNRKKSAFPNLCTTTKNISKFLLSLLDNKGLYRECANLQTQLSVVGKSLDKLQKDDYSLSKTVEI